MEIKILKTISQSIRIDNSTDTERIYDISGACVVSDGEIDRIYDGVVKDRESGKVVAQFTSTSGRVANYEIAEPTDAAVHTAIVGEIGQWVASARTKFRGMTE